MKALIQKILGSVIRSVLLILVTWSGAEGALSDNEVAAFISAATVVIWGVVEKILSYRKLQAAKDLPAGTSDAQVAALAKTMPILPRAGE